MLKKNIAIASLVSIGSLVLSACTINSYPTQGEKVYMDSVNGPVLVVPAPLNSNEISHFHDIPQPNRDRVRVRIEPNY